MCVAWWVVARELGAGLVDDSFIFLRYADNFASGLGPVFNPGERVEGYSSPLWMALLTLVTACGINPVTAAGALSGILGLSVAIIILVAVGTKKSDHFAAAMVAAAFLATHPTNAFWSRTGMDTALFAALSLLTLVLLRRENSRAPWLLLGGLVLAAMATTVSLGGDHFPLHRFLLPTLGFIAYGLARSGAELTRRLPILAGIRGAAVLACVVLLLGVSNYRLLRHSAPDTHAEVMLAERWSEVGRWFRDNADAEATMASIVVGAIPYYSNLECIDLLGLTDATVAREGNVYSEGAVGHQRYHTDYVLSRRPTYILLNQSGLYDEPNTQNGLRHAYALWDILQDPRTTDSYDLRTVTMSNGKVILFLELMDQG